MRVYLLNDSFPPQIDGVANCVFNYASYIQKNHGSAMVLTPSYPRAWDSYAFDVVRYPSLPVEKILGYRAGLAMDTRTHYLAAQNPPDLIHSHCPFMSSVLARALKEELHAPLVFTYHTKFDQDLKNLLHNPPLEALMTRFIVDNISASEEVWTVSQGAGENLKSLGYKGDVRVMPNGVDFPLGDTRGGRTEALRARHAIPEGVPVFLFVGRMIWYKGQRTILDSLKLLAQSGQDCRMIFVGDGMDLEEIKAYARSIGLESRVIFTGAVHDRELLRDYFSMSDLLLFPSLYDTNGIVVREAAACALGSLLIEGSCAAEGIVDGETGLLCGNSPEDMARRLTSALKNGSMAYVGQLAQREIYLSWEEAVAIANRRYEWIVEEYRAGRLHAPKQLSTGMYALNAEMQGYMNRVIDQEKLWSKQFYQLRRKAAWKVLRERRKANFHVHRMRGKIRSANTRVRAQAGRSYRRVAAASKKVWEDIARYL